MSGAVNVARGVATTIVLVLVGGGASAAVAAGSSGSSAAATTEAAGGASTGEALYPQEVGGDPTDTSVEDAEGPLNQTDAGPVPSSPGPAEPSLPTTGTRPRHSLNPVWLAKAKAEANAKTPAEDHHPAGEVSSEPRGSGPEEPDAEAEATSEEPAGTAASAVVIFATEGLPDPTRVLLNRPGVRAESIEGENPVPPDTTGAISPHSYIEATNGRVVLDRRSDLKRQARVSFTRFVAAAPGDFVSDPQVEWDPQAGRWLYVAVRERESKPHRNYIAVGWSKTGHPRNLTSDWCHFFLERTSSLDDFPKLGHNDSDLIIGSNRFSGNEKGAKAEGSRITTVEKPPLGSTRCRRPAFSRHPISSGFGPDPANTFASSADGYVVAVEPLGGNHIKAWDVTGPARTPAVTELPATEVGPYTVPPSAAQPGTTDRLDTGEAELTQVVAMPDPTAGGALRLWTQHTIPSAEGRSAVRWYELAAGAETAVQEGNVEVSGDYAFNGAISPAADGTGAVINFDVSGPTTRPEIQAMSRNVGTPPGQMTGGVTLGNSLASDIESGCEEKPEGGEPEVVCRWGDYAGATPDPNSMTTVWGSNQLLGTVPHAQNGAIEPYWRTRNFELEPEPPVPTVETLPGICEFLCDLGRAPATLRGKVNPNGSATTYYFEHGLSTAYGQTTPVTSAGSGTTAAEVSAQIPPESTCFAGGTTHFRLVATNAAGTSHGADREFRYTCPT